MGGLWSPDGRSKAQIQAEEDARRKYVLNASSYQNAFPSYGVLPPPNKKPAKPFAKGWAKFDGKSEAMQVYSGDGQEKHFEKAKEEKTRVVAYKKH